jgi:molybdopterin/thiamine biosynthesis adenylyltransferase
VFREGRADAGLGRYERQMLLPGWTVETQETLRRSKVFVAGAGGLGCPVALNLALVGVGRIRVCDFDAIEMNNLNRHFLHAEMGIGTNKAHSARAALSTVNSEIAVEAISRKITETNVDDIVGDAEVIVDCLDNFPARYALNLCAIRKGIPMVHGAIWGMEGHVTFLHPPATPCLSCIFPKASHQEQIPAVGAACGAIGGVQSIETIKYLADMGNLLTGRMLVLDLSRMKFQELEISRDPSCPVCGQLG